jgi:hypothetical protein
MLTHEPESFLKEAKPISPKSSYSPKNHKKCKKKRKEKTEQNGKFNEILASILHIMMTFSSLPERRKNPIKWRRRRKEQD